MKKIIFLVFFNFLFFASLYANHTPHENADGGLGEIGTIKNEEVEILSEDLVIKLGPQEDLCPYGCMAGKLDLEAQYKMSTRTQKPAVVRAVFPIVDPGSTFQWEIPEDEEENSRKETLTVDPDTYFKEHEFMVAVDGKQIKTETISQTEFEESFRGKWEKLALEYLERNQEVYKIFLELKEAFNDPNPYRFISPTEEVYLAHKLGINTSAVDCLGRIFLGKGRADITPLINLMYEINPSFEHPLIVQLGVPSEFLKPQHGLGIRHIMRLYSYEFTLQPNQIHTVRVQYRGLTSNTFTYLIKPVLQWADFKDMNMRIFLPPGPDPVSNLPLGITRNNDGIVLEGFFEMPMENLILRYGDDVKKKGAGFDLESLESFESFEKEKKAELLSIYLKDIDKKNIEIENALAKLLMGSLPSFFDTEKIKSYEDLPWEDLMPFLWRECFHKDFGRQRLAAGIIAIAPKKNSAFVLVQLLSHPDQFVRIDAEMALERISNLKLSKIPGEVLPEKLENIINAIPECKDMPDWLKKRIQSYKENYKNNIDAFKENVELKFLKKLGFISEGKQ